MGTVVSLVFFNVWNQEIAKMRDPLVIQAAAQMLSAYDYWINFHSYVPNWGPIALMLCAQR